MNSYNDIEPEIQRRILVANRSFYGMLKYFHSRTITRATKLRLYKILIRPVLMYGSESWAIPKAQDQVLSCFERWILSRIFGAVRVSNEWRQRTSAEIKEQSERLRWTNISPG